MPEKNGTGPVGRGTGRGLGRGLKPGKGPGGNCVCPSCGTRIPHQPRNRGFGYNKYQQILIVSRTK